MRGARRVVAGVMSAGLLFGGLAACGNDDDTDGVDVDVTSDVTSPDLDPGAGDGLPGDSSDETGDTSVDLDPGAGGGLPGDSADETTIP